MAQLVIRGHPTRGNEVIEILEMLGGSNPHTYSADCDSLCFYIGKGANIIYYYWVSNCCGDEDIFVFTLEEFLERFPYKIGDKVSSKYLKNYKIKKMEWEDINNRVIYKLQGMGWYSANELQPYKEEAMDKANKSVFDANAQCCDIMNHLIKEETMEKVKYNWAKWDLPDGYEFQDKDGNIINTSVIRLVKKQPHYPKTYEECCDVLKIPNDERYIDIDVPLDYNKLLFAFTELIICRNAYWKIAGKQMGLGEPWEPDWKDCTKPKYTIHLHCDGHVFWQDVSHTEYRWLSFPTIEMRDAFFENFRESIKSCKELL